MADDSEKRRRRAPRRGVEADEVPSVPVLDEVQTSGEPVRLAKMMARAGLCSRRDAEAWIRAGRVAVNGRTVETPAINVGPQDQVSVDGRPVGRPERTRLFLFHKPRGLVTTAKDPEGRETIFDALPADLPRLVTIGRLDINTEGLLLLTNDGGLARLLELPATGWLRRYRVRANGAIDQAQLDALADGITVDGVDYQGIEAKLDRVQGANVWLTMGLREGKNREIKRVLEHLGMSVNRLIRLSFGPFQLADLEEGAVEEVKTRVLRDQLGPDLASKAGVDFDGPATAAIVTREVRSEKAQERREQREREAEPRPRRNPSMPPPAGRRHVTSLRAGADTEARLGPRRKTERSATADRRGRPVAVERVSVASRSATAEPPSRNGRRFEREREEAAGGPRSRPPRESGSGRSSRTGDARPTRAQRRDEPGEGDRTTRRPPGRRPRALEEQDGTPRPARRAAGGEGEARRPARGERPSPGRPPRSSDRSPGGNARIERPKGRPPRPARPDHGGGAAPRSRPPRSGAPRGGSGDGNSRPPRSPGGGGRGRRPG